MGKDFRLLFLLFFTLSFAWAEEPFRTFKTPQGKSFEGKVVGYEGQTFILSNKAGALFKVPFNALSNEDKSYLIEAVQQNRIPKGTPTSLRRCDIVPIKCSVIVSSIKPEKHRPRH